jgi:hypothetical protein
MLTVKVTNKMDGKEERSVTSAMKETGLKEVIKLGEVTSEAKYNDREKVYMNMSNLHVREKGLEHGYKFSY